MNPRQKWQQGWQPVHALARQSPLRRVSLSDAGITVQLGASESRTRWRDLRGICTQDGRLIVAAGLFRSFAIPVSFLPEGAHGFVVSHFTASRGCRTRVR